MFELFNKTIANSGVKDPWDEGSGSTRIAWVLSTVIGTVSIIAFGVSFVMLAYSFIMFITSTGDPKAIEKPKSAVVWSIIGLVLATLLRSIKVILLKTLGYDSESFF